MLAIAGQTARTNWLKMFKENVFKISKLNFSRKIDFLNILFIFSSLGNTSQSSYYILFYSYTRVYLTETFIRLLTRSKYLLTQACNSVIKVQIYINIKIYLQIYISRTSLGVERNKVYLA